MKTPPRRPGSPSLPRPTPSRQIDDRGGGDNQFTTLELTLQIDKNKLDDECPQHPRGFFKVSEAAVLSQSRLDALKLDIKEYEAELDANLREEDDAKVRAAEAALEKQKKLTEQAIKKLIALDPRLQQMNRRFIQMTYETSRLFALVEAFKERGYQLTNLVTLSVANYYSSNVGTPRGPMRDVARERTEQNAERVRSGQQRFER